MIKFSPAALAFPLLIYGRKQKCCYTKWYRKEYCILQTLKYQNILNSCTYHSFAMKNIQDTVVFLNPGQTPVKAADQPLYALPKQIQCERPDYGEYKFVIMFGGLHIQMAALKSLGKLQEDSGWTSSAIVEAGMASSVTGRVYPDCIKCHQDQTGSQDHSMHPRQIDERSIERLLV